MESRLRLALLRDCPQADLGLLLVDMTGSAQDCVSRELAGGLASLLIGQSFQYTDDTAAEYWQNFSVVTPLSLSAPFFVCVRAPPPLCNVQSNRSEHRKAFLAPLPQSWRPRGPRLRDACQASEARQRHAGALLAD